MSKFTTDEVLEILKTSGIDNKFVNETVYIYPDDYKIGDNTHIPLGDIVDLDEDDYFESFEFDENFVDSPKTTEEFIQDLKCFRNTGEMRNYSKD